MECACKGRAFSANRRGFAKKTFGFWLPMFNFFVLLSPGTTIARFNQPRICIQVSVVYLRFCNLQFISDLAIQDLRFIYDGIDL
jgi:hypothetical protein